MNKDLVFHCRSASITPSPRPDHRDQREDSLSNFTVHDLPLDHRELFQQVAIHLWQSISQRTSPHHSTWLFNNRSLSPACADPLFCQQLVKLALTTSVFIRARLHVLDHRSGIVDSQRLRLTALTSVPLLSSSGM